MDLRIEADPAAGAATSIARRLREAVRRRGRAAVALSGGSTAPPMIAVLAAADVPWEAVEVWQVDERVAPDGDRARNAGQLAPLVAMACRVRPMPVTAADLREAARRYAATLPERFDVVHLGIGDDGHTASWPPGRDEIRDSERAVELAADFHGWDRMTLTRRVVNAARSRVVLAVGEQKRSVIERWLLRDAMLPVDGVRRSGTTVFLDEAAAPPVPLDHRLH